MNESAFRARVKGALAAGTINSYVSNIRRIMKLNKIRKLPDNLNESTIETLVANMNIGPAQTKDCRSALRKYAGTMKYYEHA